MKKLLAVATTVLIIASSAQAGGYTGQCVFPKTKIAKNGSLEFKKEISLYRSPKDKEGTPLTLMRAFKVQAQDGPLIQLVDKESGKAIGWSKLSDFERQDLRNCEF